MIFSYPNSTDEYLNATQFFSSNENTNIEEITVNLTKNIKIENNIFGYIFSCINIYELTGCNDLTLKSALNNEIINSGYNLTKNEIIKLSFKTQEKSFNCSIYFRYVVTEPDYSDHINYFVENMSCEFDYGSVYNNHKTKYFGKISFYNIFYEYKEPAIPTTIIIKELPTTIIAQEETEKKTEYKNYVTETIRIDKTEKSTYNKELNEETTYHKNEIPTTVQIAEKHMNYINNTTLEILNNNKSEYNSTNLESFEDNLNNYSSVEQFESNQTVTNVESNIYNDSSNGVNKFIQKLENITIDNIIDIKDLISDNSLIAYLQEESNMIVFQGVDNNIFQITLLTNEKELLKNKSNNINNLSIIDFEDCEKELRKEYHINESDSLIFIKNEKITNKASEKDVKFEVYEPYNKTKLNLSVCDGKSYNLYIPTELSEETKQLYEQMKEAGYDLFNINDPFYQDTCTPFDSPDGTDILLSDRINYIYNNSDTKCQSNCQLSQYSIETKYINCSCIIDQNNNNDNSDDTVDKFSTKKLYESYYDVLKYSNYNIMKCYNLILNLNIFKKNIGSTIVLIFFSFYIIFLFVYIFQGVTPLKIKLMKDIAKEKGQLSNNKRQLYKSKNKNILNPLYPPTKKKSFFVLNLNNKTKNTRNINIKKNNLKIPDSRNQKKIIKDSINIHSHSSNMKNILNNSRFANTIIDLKPKNDKKNNNIRNNFQQRKLDDFELNELNYDEALKLDKRSLFQIYWSILKREHLIIFTFINCNDYNLLSIKISKCLFLMVTDMSLNSFFFSDDSMHKLFLNYGKYDIFQQIPQMVYSTIFSQLIEVFLCFLILTDKFFYKIKSNLLEGKLVDIMKILRIIDLKLAVFFFFAFVFFVVYWYIITVFCAVYKNTQKIFIKDSIISFLISLSYSLVLYFISSCLRLCSLKCSKACSSIIYKISDIIPFF